MKAIRFLATCLAAGAHREAGAVYTVPGQIPADEAVYLVRLGRAEAHEAEDAETAEQPVSVAAKPRKKAKAE
jgi:hypothetical protein